MNLKKQSYHLGKLINKIYYSHSKRQGYASSDLTSLELPPRAVCVQNHGEIWHKKGSELVTLVYIGRCISRTKCPQVLWGIISLLDCLIMSFQCLFQLNMRLLFLILFSIVATFASPQVDITITPDTDITLSNSANVFKAIKSGSGNLYKNTYYIEMENERTPSSKNPQSSENGNGTQMTEVDMHLSLISQVILRVTERPTSNFSQVLEGFTILYN